MPKLPYYLTPFYLFCRRWCLLNLPNHEYIEEQLNSVKKDKLRMY